MEAVFAEPENAAMKELINASSEGDAGIRVNAVFRQLPVGLTFDGKAVLSVGSGAAADLWALSEKKDEVIIYELKARSSKPNKKVGIISELMFYCNYAQDMFINKRRFKAQAPDAGKTADWPEYGELFEASRHGALKTLKKVHGYMLTDDLHPLITKEVLEKMRESKIEYYALEYHWKKQDDTITIETVGKLF